MMCRKSVGVAVVGAIADSTSREAGTNGEWAGRDEHVVRVFGEDVGRKHVEDLKTIATRQGHVVVRVAPGGGSYDVIVLTDADESLRVRSVHGPYSSR